MIPRKIKFHFLDVLNKTLTAFIILKVLWTLLLHFQAVASSLVGEDSLSHHVDPAIGVYIIDRYTYYALEFLEKVNRDSKATMGQFLEVCPKRLCISTVGKRTDLFQRDPNTVPITDFFGSVRNNFKLIVLIIWHN